MADLPADPALIDATETEQNPQPSELGPHEQLQTFKEWFRSDADHSKEWRAQARKDFDFVAGDQWEPEDKQFLESQKRPVITFNRTLGLVKVVTGIEINSRHETIFMPREAGEGAQAEVQANELLSGATQWMTDECDADDHQSEAFGDTTVCGMGWTEATMEWEDDPEGRYVERRIDPLEMYWDANAREKNLADSKRFWRVREMPVSEARQILPGHTDADLDAHWALGADTKGGDVRPIEERRRRLENMTAHDTRLKVTLVQVEWCERETVWIVADPKTGRVMTVDADKMEMLRIKFEPEGYDPRSMATEATQRVWYQAFVGGKVLKVTKSPYPKGSTFGCMTGERHRNKGTWFGLVSVARDPQMWANKWLSQTLHILNTTAKGGILAEKTAFENPRDAQNTYAQPDAITYVTPGALQKGMIMAKPGQGLPAGYINLLEFAISSIRDVTGINLELMGMRDANQPGILEAQRKQAAMTILATLFDSMRRFRKMNGRLRLHYIQNYLSDGRLIRIGGPDNRRIIPLLRDNTAGTYDVIVEDAPASPNMKEQTWAYVQMIIPALKGMLTPETMLIFLEYSPLPSKLIQALKKDLLGKQPDPVVQQGKLIALEGAKAEVEGEKAKTELDRAKAQQARVGAGIEALMAGLNLYQATQLPPPAPGGQPMPPQQGMPMAPGMMGQGMPVGNSLPPDFAIPPMSGGPPPPMPVPQMPQGPMPQGLLNEGMAPAMPPV